MFLDGRYNQSYTFWMKTAVSVPDRVFRSAEDLAARLRVSRSELYSNALAEFIEKHKNDLTTFRLNEVYAKNRGPSALEPEITLLQYHTTKRNA
jgi:metal-responsive CopG/Arc/MetJ family transcriptional regulator